MSRPRNTNVGLRSHAVAAGTTPSDDDFFDGWALWQEHRPQSAEDWVEVAIRCAADPEFNQAQSSPVFGAAVLLARRLRARG